MWGLLHWICHQSSRLQCIREEEKDGKIHNGCLSGWEMRTFIYFEGEVVYDDGSDAKTYATIFFFPSPANRVSSIHIGSVRFFFSISLVGDVLSISSSYFVLCAIFFFPFLSSLKKNCKRLVFGFFPYLLLCLAICFFKEFSSSLPQVNRFETKWVTPQVYCFCR